jgi:hypothetical protein
MLEARVGFEPTNGGFADLSLRPLGYRAKETDYSEIAPLLSGAAGAVKTKMRAEIAAVANRTLDLRTVIEPPM